MLIYRGSFSVFSKYVEVIPQWPICSYIPFSILQVCGGDPIENMQFLEFYQYSPSMWR